MNGGGRGVALVRVVLAGGTRCGVIFVVGGLVVDGGIGRPWVAGFTCGIVLIDGTVGRGDLLAVVSGLTVARSIGGPFCFMTCVVGVEVAGNPCGLVIGGGVVWRGDMFGILKRPRGRCWHRQTCR